MAKTDPPRTIEEAKKLTPERYAEHRGVVHRLLAGKKPLPTGDAATGPIKDEAEFAAIAADPELYAVRREAVKTYLQDRPERLRADAAAKADAEAARQASTVPPAPEPKGRELPRFSVE